MENDWLARAVLSMVMVGAGALVIWMARAAASGRLKRNDIAGIRIPSTMASDEAWLAAHVRAKRPTLWAGYVAIASGVFALLPVSIPAVCAVILLAAVAILALVFYGAHVGGKAAKAVTAGR